MSEKKHEFLQTKKDRQLEAQKGCIVLVLAALAFILGGLLAWLSM